MNEQNIKLCKGWNKNKSKKKKLNHSVCDTVIPAKSNSCQALTSRDSFSFHSRRKKLEPIMCFPYPHAAQTINGWDTLTTTFQGRRTNRQTRWERHQVGMEPLSNSGTPPWCSAGNTGSMVHLGRMSSDCGMRTEITKRQTRAVTSSRKLQKRSGATEIPRRHLLFPDAESAGSVSPNINNRQNGVYFKQRQVNVSVFSRARSR